MNEDIRILITFRGHRKVKRLKRAVGPGAVEYLINLWIGAAISRPDGVLSGWIDEDIADEADYDGEASEFVNALLDAGWLIKDKKADCYQLHDWDQHQGWVVGSTDRSNKSKIAALIKHHGCQKGLLKAWEQGINPIDYGYSDFKEPATDLPPACQAHAKRMPARHAPSPSPSLNDFNKLKSAKAVKSKKYFSERSGEYLEPIRKACNEILKLPNKNGSKFNPFQFVQMQINKSQHPGAILKTLEGMKKLWPSIEDPWPYALGTMKTVNGNFNEADAIKKSNQFKALLAELSDKLQPD